MVNRRHAGRQVHVLISSVCALVLGAATAVASAECLAPAVCAFIDRDYIDQRRLEPTRLVGGVMTALYEMKPGVTAAWDPRGLILHQADHPDTVIPRRAPASLMEVAALIQDLDGCFIADADCHCCDLDYALINGALRCLDPYTKVLPPAQAQTLDDELGGGFGGIGANLRVEGVRLVVDGVRPGLPADCAGMVDGDCLVTVGGHSTIGMPVDEAIGLLRGKIGTTVTWSIERAGASRPLLMSAVRTEIPAITVRSYRVGGVLYVRMDEFSASVARDLRQEIDTQLASCPVTAVVLDLRHNGGGIVDQACEISADFLPQGSDIVRVLASRAPAVTYVTRHKPRFEMPLVVLVSDRTASAAEILAGTLQCHGRAVVVGGVTHGKGLIQAIHDLPDGSQCICSVGEYRLPGDIRVQGIGIMPDIVINASGAMLAQSTAVGLPSTGAGRYRVTPLAVLDRRDLEGMSDVDMLDPHFVPEAGALSLMRHVTTVTITGERASSASFLNALVTAVVAEVPSPKSVASSR